MRIEICRDREDLARVASEHIASWLRDPRHTTIGLAGGSTPRRTYELLADTDLPWDTVTGWMTDERHVPVDDERSNAGMAARALFDHVPARLCATSYRTDAVVQAAEYAATLARLLGSGGIGLVLLGLGDDGHTASLFPETQALAIRDADFAANWVPAQSEWRLTATRPLLSRADQTVFLVSGAAKADAVARILRTDSDLPAAVVSSEACDPIWLLDEAAAAGLE